MVKRILSFVLTFCVAFAGILPVLANASEISAENVILADENITNDITSTGKLSTKLSYLRATSLFSDTSLRMTAMPQTFMDEKSASNTNLVSAIKLKYYTDSDFSTINSTVVEKVTDGKIVQGNGTEFLNTGTGEFIGTTNSTIKDKFHSDSLTDVSTLTAEERIAKIESRFENDQYDAEVILDLGTSTDITDFYMFNHVRKNTSICAYKVYISDEESELFSAQNEALCWYYGGHPSASNLFNNDNTNGKTQYNRSEGQFWSFLGEKRPQGRYIGVKIYDASTNYTCNYLSIYDIGVYGVTIPKISAENVILADENITNDITSTGKLSTKLSYLRATSLFSDTSLRMTAMPQTFMDEKSASNTNLVSAIKLKYYADTDFSNIDSTVLEKVTDGKIAQGNGTEFLNTGTGEYIGTIASSIKDKFHSDSLTDVSTLTAEERIAKIESRFENDQYDAEVILDLGISTDITDFYMFNHVRKNTSICAYKVYISDEESELFSAQNEALCWYYGGHPSASNLFNNDNTNGKTQYNRSEGQFWSFLGEKRPQGRYIGVKIYDASTIYAYNYLSIYDIGVYGIVPETCELSFDHTEAVEPQIKESLILKGESAEFEIKKGEDITITSVAANGKEISPQNGVYKIDTVLEDTVISIETSEDELFPKNGIYNGIDLTRHSAFSDQSFWNNDIIYAESVVIYNGKTEFSLAYPADRVISVRSYDLKTSYLYGVDYLLNESGKIVLPEGSRIPSFEDAEDLKDLTTTDENGKLVLDGDEITARQYELYKYQIAVTYSYSKTWGKDYLYETAPESRATELGSFYEKLMNGEEATIVVYGDSTALGCNSSGLNQLTYAYSSNADASTLNPVTKSTYPYLGLSEVPDWASDTWSVQLHKFLKKNYANENINLINKAIGSTKAEWGSKEQNLEFLLQGTCPDLMIIGYGGNSSGISSEKTNEYTSAIIDYVRANINPNCAFVINTVNYRKYTSLTIDNLDAQAQGLLELETKYDNVIVAPLRDYTKSLVTSEKEHLDYLFNAYNHMNDYGARFYSQVLQSLLARKQHKVTFLDRNGNKLYSTYVSDNGLIPLEDISNASALVPDIFGYDKVTDESGNIAWSEAVTTPITADITLQALYKKSKTMYNVIVEKEDGSTETLTPCFDDKIRIVDSDAKYWKLKDSGVVIAVAQNGVSEFYAFGDANILEVLEEAPETPSVEFVRMESGKESNGKRTLVVLAHVTNPQEKEITRVGVSFLSATKFNSLEDKSVFWKEAFEENAIPVGSIEYDTRDFMITLTGISEKANVVRYAQAFVEFSDGSIVLSETPVYYEFPKVD